MSSAHVPVAACPYPHWVPVIEAICEAHKVAWSEVIAGYRDPRVVACRHEIWASLYLKFRSSYAVIGARTGGFHKTTVIHAVRKAPTLRGGSALCHSPLRTRSQLNASFRAVI